MPTTVHRVAAKFDLLADLGADEAIRDAGPGDNFPRAPMNIRPSTIRTWGLSCNAASSTPRTVTLLIPSAPILFRLMMTTTSLELMGRAVRGPRDLRHIGDDTSRLPIDDAHDLACRCLAHHGDVVIGTRRLQCLLHAIGHHQYGGKNKHHERDAKDRKDCG